MFVNTEVCKPGFVAAEDVSCGLFVACHLVGSDKGDDQLVSLADSFDAFVDGPHCAVAVLDRQIGVGQFGGGGADNAFGVGDPVVEFEPGPGSFPPGGQVQTLPVTRARPARSVSARWLGSSWWLA